jgi:RimJ/RimL family protein N-acetyltransferase
MPDMNETILHADGLLLRPLRSEDADEVFAAAHASRREIGRWLEWCHEDYQRHETVEFLANQPEAWAGGQAYSFGIFDAATLRFLGGAGLNGFHEAQPFANLGYWVRTDATGGGVASRAARRVAEWALPALGLARIEIVAAADNAASRRVAEKAGARFEGVLRNRLVIHGQPADAAMYSLVKEDFA